MKEEALSKQLNKKRTSRKTPGRDSLKKKAKFPWKKELQTNTPQQNALNFSRSTNRQRHGQVGDTSLYLLSYMKKRRDV